MTPTFDASKPCEVDGVLYGLNAEVAAWVNLRLNADVVKVPYYAIGIIPQGADGEQIIANRAQLELAGGAYFYNHIERPRVGTGGTWSEVMVAVAADDVNAANPAVIRKILAYPFAQLGCDQIVAEIMVTNERAIRQAEKLGFEIVGYRGPKGSEVATLVLTPEKCPFWTGKPEKEAA